MSSPQHSLRQRAAHRPALNGSLPFQPIRITGPPAHPWQRSRCPALLASALCFHQPARARHAVQPRPRRPITSTHAVAAAAAATQATQNTAAQWVAVLLGNAVLLGSLFRSLPQILKVVRNGHAEGLSLASNVVELLCFTIIMAYNVSHGYAFNTFGEVVACWVQDIVIVLLLFKHMRASGLQVAGATAAFGAICGALFWPGLMPRAWLDVAQAWNLVFMALGSRVPQVWMNFKRGNAGVLSLTTCLLNVAGNVARAFTTVVLTQDTLLLTGCVTQGVLNTVILGQVLHTRFGPGKASVSQAVEAGAADAGLLVLPTEQQAPADTPQPTPVLKPA